MWFSLIVYIAKGSPSTIRSVNSSVAAEVSPGWTAQSTIIIVLYFTFPHHHVYTPTYLPTYIVWQCESSGPSTSIIEQTVLFSTTVSEKKLDGDLPSSKFVGTSLCLSGSFLHRHLVVPSDLPTYIDLSLLSTYTSLQQAASADADGYSSSPGKKAGEIYRRGGSSRSSYEGGGGGGERSDPTPVVKAPAPVKKDRAALSPPPINTSLAGIAIYLPTYLPISLFGSQA